MPGPINLPRNVAWFEALLYSSLMMDAVSVAFRDRTPNPNTTPAMIMAATILDGVLILLFLYFVHLAARGRKNWPRWVLGVALLLSVISLFWVIGSVGLQIDSAIEIVSCVLTAAGLYLSFSGDARGWFNA